MDIAVLADIHGNYLALDRCMNFALEKGVHTFLFLGDYIGELAYPVRTMERLYNIKDNYNCTFIRGNKEDYWMDYRKNGNESYGWVDYNSTTGMLLYAYHHLTDKDIDFFETLPIVQKVEMAGEEPFFICHGSPYKVNEKMILGSDRIHEIMDLSETRFIICGHTHEQSKTLHNGKMALNPGSVGIPLLSNRKTQFLILHSAEGRWQEEFISLDYDVDAVVEDMYKEYLDIHAPYLAYSTEKVLKEGKISTAIVVSKAMALCKADTGECKWPFIPEKYWEQAVRELYE